MQSHDTNENDDDSDLEKLNVPNIGSSGGSFSGPHHRKLVCSSSGGATQFIKTN